MKDFLENIQHLYTENYFLFLRPLVHRPPLRNPDPQLRNFLVLYCLIFLFYRMGTTRDSRTMHQTSTKKCIVERPTMTMKA
jgi:hypothetical protein